MNIAEAVSRDPEIMGGELCFSGTRVPVRILIGYLRAGHDLSYFLEGFPTVSREQAEAVLQEAESLLEHSLPKSA